MTIAAEIIADSINAHGNRLTTMQLRYPRFVHAEFMTHRVFSRNASSSRAIPVKRLIEDIRRDPAMPVFWGSNKPGMQAGEELKYPALDAAKAAWLSALELAVIKAEQLMGYGLHKQIANRVLEPWAHINVIVTATEWSNFYALRCHPAAQPEMRALAEAMLIAQVASQPVELQPHQWHLPYVHYEEQEQHGTPTCIKLSVARCARVSYLTHDGKQPDIEDDLKLYERLVGGVPIHASPAEHQATPDSKSPYNIPRCWDRPDEHANFVGWRQFRKQLEKSA